ncbi:MAG TPA: histidine phosphatase family protein [Steroidobacteraceae bacterium]|nr:histidine phosphatase family protein [Steroidobacteraceae bacterium]
MPARSQLRLTLVRHAKTEPAAPGQEDWDRVLEPRGQRDAPEMARRMKQHGLKPDLILSSPAVRAITTATIMLRELGVAAQKLQQDERLYLASPKDMLSVIHELGGRARHLMVVGHNPGMTEFADRISAEREVDNMPTCAVYSLQFEIKEWSELAWDSGVDADLDYPKRSG